jgi:hypothetical protein
MSCIYALLHPLLHHPIATLELHAHLFVAPIKVLPW